MGDRHDGEAMRRGRWVAPAAGLGLLALALGAALTVGPATDPRGALRLAAAVLIGAVAGVALYHAAFGFTGGWRLWVRERRGAGVRAQCLLVGLTCLVTYPLIGWEGATGLDMHPVILPMSFTTAMGALVFGFGMQLGGGCASGTLFTAGGGSTRMVLTLAAFVAGSALGSAHLVEHWRGLGPEIGWPTIPGTSLIALAGPLGALALLAAALAAVSALTALIERRTHGALEPARAQGSWIRGPWARWAGAGVLAGVGIACFLVFQRPWGVTAGFALWGAKAADVIGFDPASWGYWQPGWRAAQLEASLLSDRTSVMNLAILLGAMAAAGLAGRFAPVWRLSGRDLATAVIGGLLMGYGARLAGGCNIGAFLGGLASGSAHGAWWALWGFLGSWAGSRMRAAIAMDPPWPRRSAPA